MNGWYAYSLESIWSTGSASSSFAFVPVQHYKVSLLYTVHYTMYTIHITYTYTALREFTMFKYYSAHVQFYTVKFILFPFIHDFLLF